MKPAFFVRRSLSLLLCASLTGALFTGCKKGDDMFPSIEAPVTGSDTTESSAASEETSSDSEIRRLNVALPYSDLTVQCLASMFYCKNN